MKRESFRFFEPLRVRWVEVDMQKIVFNGHYLMYFDTAIAGYWRAMAMPYHETMEHLAGDLYVRKATLEYHGSARYDDRIDVGLRCERIGKSSIIFIGGVFRGEKALVMGDLVYVFADPTTQTSRPVPDALRAVLNGFEAGEPMVTAGTAPWPEIADEARALRKAVFVAEQRLPDEFAQDGADSDATHAIVRNRFGMVVATGRLVQAGPGVGALSRIAVAQSVRGAGLGRRVVDLLVEAARRRGWREVTLVAQPHALPFYARAGFAPRGPAFEAEGLPHQQMTLAL